MAKLGIELKKSVVIVPQGQRAFVEDAYGRRLYLTQAVAKGRKGAAKPKTIPARPMVPDAWIVGGGWDSRCCPRCVSYRGQKFKKKPVLFPLHPHCHHYWVPVYAGFTDVYEPAFQEPVVENVDGLKMDKKTLVAVFGPARVRLMEEDGLKLSDLYRKGTDELKTLAELGVERSYAKTGKRIITKAVVETLKKKEVIAQIKARVPDFEPKSGWTLKNLIDFLLALVAKAA